MGEIPDINNINKSELQEFLEVTKKDTPPNLISTIKNRIFSQQTDVGALELSEKQGQKILKRNLSHINLKDMEAKIMTLRDNKDLAGLQKVQKGLEILKQLKAIDIKYANSIHTVKIEKLLTDTNLKIAEINRLQEHTPPSEIREATPRPEIAGPVTKISKLKGYRKKITFDDLGDIANPKTENTYLIESPNQQGVYTIYIRQGSGFATNRYDLKFNEKSNCWELNEQGKNAEKFKSTTSLDGKWEIHHNIDGLPEQLNAP